MLKAAFIFVAPKADPAVHRSEIETETLHLITVGVESYNEAAKAVEKLLEEGVTAFELCGGFGHVGTAIVTEAVGDRGTVGVVRFDIHPGLDNRSGDELF
ncbi:hypothetical protein SAMN02745751_01318 [Dethiosulfatibacter aminovorans DSM 17477]|uniref:Uncharacterized protein n=1 Tax=Dethiosulfatibacter aminovorans DSM 17477 TaxID=1121476 RepID=A0A1M6F1H2_9FIRM|nr:DUF6506 family protein [Dethiosulfatibacter aminovorans]SHI91506.1 hypothetical protein SAMN02745751_01318 [Dethiosulfatibacter aminovorans DSM 17477]